MRVGNEVTAYAERIASGRTSMTFEVTAWRPQRDGDDVHKVTGAIFTSVAFHPEGRPRPMLS